MQCRLLRLRSGLRGSLQATSTVTGWPARQTRRGRGWSPVTTVGDCGSRQTAVQTGQRQVHQQATWSETGRSAPRTPMDQRLSRGCTAVSYTHLRAHETRHDLVCRLLLEKKKKKR